MIRCGGERIGAERWCAGDGEYGLRKTCGGFNKTSVSAGLMTIRQSENDAAENVENDGERVGRQGNA